MCTMVTGLLGASCINQQLCLFIYRGLTKSVKITRAELGVGIMWDTAVTGQDQHRKTSADGTPCKSLFRFFNKICKQCRLC